MRNIFVREIPKNAHKGYKDSLTQDSKTRPIKAEMKICKKKNFQIKQRLNSTKQNF